MKTSTVFGLAAASIVAISLSAWSQTPATASDAAGAASGASASAPTGRKADRALRRKVYAEIVKVKEIRAGDISVSAKDGAVTLNGTVTDAAQIPKVEAIARGVPGVVSVTNKLTVKKPFGGM
ncbi:BON domain-containing protein [Paraburkholderia sp.]|uniref:BON domain-containing protein n=1 Tax=Paraburkholderia sp. TaxID=1926495 RepID=UPI00286F55FB|nr:BON domain-containing protein [Paraburkholderia sp.]